MEEDLKTLRKELFEAKVKLQLLHMHKDTKEYQETLDKVNELDHKFRISQVKIYKELKKGR